MAEPKTKTEPTEAPIATPPPSGGQLWRILRGGPQESRNVRAGMYDDIVRELYDMAIRHEPSMVQTIAERLDTLKIEIPADDSPVQKVIDPKPFAGLRRRG